MEQVTLADAKEHLDDLMRAAARGEDVRIADPKLGTVRLTPVAKAPDVTAPRVTDTMPPFVPLKHKRVLGQLEGKVPPPPDDFFDPMSEEELRDWYGDDALVPSPRPLTGRGLG